MFCLKCGKKSLFCVRRCGCGAAAGETPGWLPSELLLRSPGSRGGNANFPRIFQTAGPILRLYYRLRHSFIMHEPRRKTRILFRGLRKSGSSAPEESQFFCRVNYSRPDLDAFSPPQPSSGAANKSSPRVVSVRFSFLPGKNLSDKSALPGTVPAETERAIFIQFVMNGIR